MMLNLYGREFTHRLNRCRPTWCRLHVGVFMKSFSRVLMVVTVMGGASLGLSLLSCSAGGPSVPPGTQCDPRYMPFVMTPDVSQTKLSYAPGQNSSSIMPAGMYLYDHVDIYYVGNDAVNPLQIDFRDSAVGSPGNTTQSIVCVRNFNPAISNVNVNVNVVSNILVNADLSQTVYYRNVQFSIVNGIYNFPVPTFDVT